jgi:hypothetical protein
VAPEAASHRRTTWPVGQHASLEAA